MPMSLEKKEHRLQFRFWLDIIRPEEDQLAEYVENLKEKRSFAQTIREALHLIQDLRQGRVEVLLHLFPWIEDHFAKPVHAPATLALSDPLQQKLDRLEQYIRQIPATTTANTPPQPKLLAEPLQDEEPLIEIKADKDSNTVWNNLIAMAKMSNFYDELPLEVIEYGVKNGRIPAHLVKIKPVLATSAPPKERDAPRKMDIPDLAPPIFDDDDDPIDLFN